MESLLLGFGTCIRISCLSTRQHTRACCKYQEFVGRGKQGYRKAKLVSTFKKFYGRHHDLVSKLISDLMASVEAKKGIQIQDFHFSLTSSGSGRVVRWCWVNLQCRGVLLIWIRVEQGHTALAMGAGGGCLDIFTFVYHFSFFPSLWETARYRLKYCLKEPLSPKHPTNQPLTYPTDK